MVVQVDTIFVSGMNQDLNEEDIADHFGSIGLIKVSLNSNCIVRIADSTLFLKNYIFRRNFVTPLEKYGLILCFVSL